MYKPIKVPTFILMQQSQAINISEYDVRCIQVRVKEGKMNPKNFILYDEDNVRAEFREDGMLNNELKGMNINSDYAFMLLTNPKLKN